MSSSSPFQAGNAFVDSLRSAWAPRASTEVKEKFLSELQDIVHSINPSVAVGFFDRLLFSGEGLIHSGGTSTEEKEVAGLAQQAQKIVSISVNLQKFTKRILVETAYHEAMHSIEGLLNKEQQQILFEAFPGTAIVQQWFAEHPKFYASLQQTFPDKDDVELVNTYSDFAFGSKEVSEETRKIFQTLQSFLSAQGKKAASKYPKQRVGDIFDIPKERMNHKERVALNFGRWAAKKHFEKPSLGNQTSSDAERVFLQTFSFINKIGDWVKKLMSHKTSKDIFEQVVSGNIGKNEKRIGRREYDTVPLVATNMDILFKESFFAREFKKEEVEKIFYRIVIGEQDIATLIKPQTHEIQKRILREVLTYARIGGILRKGRKKTNLMNDLARRIKSIDLSLNTMTFSDFSSLKDEKHLNFSLGGLLEMSEEPKDFSLIDSKSFGFSLGKDKTDNNDIKNFVAEEIMTDSQDKNAIDAKTTMIPIVNTKEDSSQYLKKETKTFIEKQKNAGWNYTPSFQLNLSHEKFLEIPAIVHPSGEVGIVFIGERAYTIDCKFNRRIFCKTPDTKEYSFPHVGENPKDFDLMSKFADKLCVVAKDLREDGASDEEFVSFLQEINNRMKKDIVEYEEKRVENALHFSIEQNHKNAREYLNDEKLYGYMPTPLNPCVGYLKNDMPILVRDSLTAEDFFDKDYCSYNINKDAKIWSLSNDTFKHSRFFFKEEEKDRRVLERHAREKDFINKSIKKVLTDFYETNKEVLAESAVRSHMEREGLSRGDAEKIVGEKFSLDNFIYLIKRGESYHFCSPQYQHEMVLFLAEAIRRSGISGLDGIEINNKLNYETHIFNPNVLEVNWSDNIEHMKNIKESFKKRKEGEKKFYETITPEELNRKQEEIWRQAEKYNPDLLREEGFLTDLYLFSPVLNKDFPEPFQNSDNSTVNVCETRAEAESYSPTAQAACVHLRLNGSPQFNFIEPTDKEMKLVREFLGGKYSPAKADVLLRGKSEEHITQRFWSYLFGKHPDAIISIRSRMNGGDDKKVVKEWLTMDRGNVAIAYDSLFRKNKTRRTHLDAIGNPTLSVEQKKERLFEQIKDEGVTTPSIPGSLFLQIEEDGTLLQIEEQAKRGVASLTMEHEMPLLMTADREGIGQLNITETDKETNGLEMKEFSVSRNSTNVASPAVSPTTAPPRAPSAPHSSPTASSTPLNGVIGGSSLNGVAGTAATIASTATVAEVPLQSRGRPASHISQNNTSSNGVSGGGKSPPIGLSPIGGSNNSGKGLGLQTPQASKTFKQENKMMIDSNSKNFNDLALAYDVAVKDEGYPATAETMRTILKQSGHSIHRNIDKDFQKVSSAKESLIPLECGYCLVINPEHTTWDVVSFNALSGFLAQGTLSFVKEDRQILMDSINGNTGCYAEYLIRQNPDLYQNLMGKMRHIAKRFNPHVSVTGVPKLFDKNKNLIAGLCATDLQTVVVNLDRTKGDPEMTLLHELFHSVESLLSNDEKDTLDKNLNSYGEEGRAEAFSFYVTKNYDLLTGEKKNKKNKNIVKRVFSFMQEIQETTIDFVGVIFQGKPPRKKDADFVNIVEKVMAGNIAKRAKVFSLDARFTPVQALSIVKKAMGSRASHLLSHFGDLSSSLRIEDIENEKKGTSITAPLKEAYSRLSSFATGQGRTPLCENNDKTITGLDVCMLLRNSGADNEDIIKAIQGSGFVKIDDPKNYLQDISQTLDMARERFKRESSLTTPVSMGGSGEADPNTHPLDQVSYCPNQTASIENTENLTPSSFSSGVSDFSQSAKTVPWGIPLAVFKRMNRPKINREVRVQKNGSYGTSEQRVEVYTLNVIGKELSLPTMYKETIRKNGRDETVQGRYTVDNFLSYIHRKFLEDALEKGRYIPNEVLEDYPEFQNVERSEGRIVDSVNLEVNPSSSSFQDRATVSHARRPAQHPQCSLGWGMSSKRDELRLYDGLGMSEGHGLVGRVKKHNNGIFEAVMGGKKSFHTNETEARVMLEDSFRKNNTQSIPSPAMSFHVPNALSPDTMTIALNGKSPEQALQRGEKVLPAELQDPEHDDLLVVRFGGKPLLENLEDVRSLVEIFHEKNWSKFQKNYERELKEEELFKALCEGVEHPALKGQGGWYANNLLKEIANAGYAGYLKPSGEVVVADPGNFQVEACRVATPSLSEGIEVSLSVGNGVVPDFNYPSSFVVKRGNGVFNIPAKLQADNIFVVGQENKDIFDKLEEETATHDDIHLLAQRIFSSNKDIDAVQIGEKQNAFFVAREPREQITIDWKTLSKREVTMNRNEQKIFLQEEISRGDKNTYATIARRRLDSWERIDNNMVEKLFFFSPENSENARLLEKSKNIKISASGDLYALPANSALTIGASKKLKRKYPVRDAMLKVATSDEVVLTVPESEQLAFNEVAQKHGNTLRKRGDFYYVKKEEADKFHLWTGEAAYINWGEDLGQSWENIKQRKIDLKDFKPKTQGFSTETVLRSLRNNDHHREADNLERHALQGGLIKAPAFKEKIQTRISSSSHQI